MDDALWKEIRKYIINAIIHTDMTHHFPMVAKVRKHSVDSYVCWHAAAHCAEQHGFAVVAVLAQAHGRKHV